MTGTPIGRLAPVPIPLDKDGRGPETDPEKVVRTEWQLWDECDMTAAVCPNEDTARAMAIRWNSFLPVPS